MKKLCLILLPLCIAAITTSFKPVPIPAEGGSIKWMTWEQVQEAQKLEPRKVFVDVYTGWCGWCKRMDSTTFIHGDIVKFINDNFYAVKFDAESRNTIVFKGSEYKYISDGYRGYNQLAAELLKGQMGYPTSVYLDEKLTPVFIKPGYQTPPMLEQTLNYIAGNNYKSLSLDEFRQQFKGKVR